jgi:hypothetical protein
MRDNSAEIRQDPVQYVPIVSQLAEEVSRPFN